MWYGVNDIVEKRYTFTGFCGTKRFRTVKFIVILYDIKSIDVLFEYKVIYELLTRLPF